MDDRPANEAVVDLPDIPGGWTTHNVTLADRTLELMLPAVPDRFLDDPAVLEANRRDDYMPYWSYLWPASLPMANALPHAPWPVGSEVLELGSGIGLVGLAALLRGDDVTFSDYDETALQACRLNAVRNSLPLPKTLQLDWRAPLDRQFPVIIGCEVIYDRQLHAPMLALLKKMLATNGVCWLADPGRSQAPRFYEQAVDEGFRVVVYDNHHQPRPRPSDNDFQIIELRR